jgi:hypothetical protein
MMEFQFLRKIIIVKLIHWSVFLDFEIPSMGNVAGSNRPQIDPKYLKPGSLYDHSEWNLDLIKESILSRRIAPFFVIL